MIVMMRSLLEKEDEESDDAVASSLEAGLAAGRGTAVVPTLT
jgi:hypothetical protein